jgi:hypothetical protein
VQNAAAFLLDGDLVKPTEGDTRRPSSAAASPAKKAAR